MLSAPVRALFIIDPLQVAGGNNSLIFAAVIEPPKDGGNQWRFVIPKGALALATGRANEPRLTIDNVELRGGYDQISKRFTIDEGVLRGPTAGLALTGAATHQHLATGFDIGKRFHSAPVIRLADARPMHLGHCIEADARFRLFLFAPAADAGAAGGPVATLCDWLEHDPASPLRRHTPRGADIDSVIDTRAVFQQGFRDLAYERMPTLLRPHVGAHGLCDYEKVFCADTKAGEDIFTERGIDRAAGCMVVVRPDQYVGHILPLSAREELAAYFAGILRVRG